MGIFNSQDTWITNIGEGVINAIKKILPGGIDSNIDVQNPMPSDGDSVYAKDLILDLSDEGDFIITSDSTASKVDILTSMVSDVHIEKKNNTSNNPKFVILKFKRPILTTSFGIDSGGVGTFSNVKLTVYQGQLPQVIADESTDNTKHLIKLFSSAPLKFDKMLIEFHTADTVTTGLFGIFKYVEVSARLQALSRITGHTEDIFSINGALAINEESKSTLPIDTYLAQAIGAPKLLANDTIIDSYDIEMSAEHGLLADDEILIAEDGTNPRSYSGKVITVSINTLTMDNPMDTIFSSSGSIVLKTIKELNVNGSITPQIFSIINGAEVPFNISRIIVHITDGAAMDDGKFGGISILTRGVLFRKKFADGSYNNIFNVKSNGELGELAYDKTYDAKAPAGVYGITIRMSFGGLHKHGTIINIDETEKLEMIIQDDLTDLTSFRVMVEGHMGLPPLS